MAESCLRFLPNRRTRPNDGSAEGSFSPRKRPCETHHVDVSRAFLIPLSIMAAVLGCSPDAHREPLALTIGSHGLGAGQFFEPRAIAASPEGEIFVIDRTGRVQRFDSSGRFEHQWTMPDNTPGRGMPSGICVDRSGRVFVADTHFHRVVVFDRNGGELFRFGERGLGPGHFMFPTDVVVDSAGFIYVSEFGGNDRVSKFEPDGNFILSFGGLEDGLAALQRPSALAIDSHDNVWVADTSNHRICAFDPEGTLITTFGSLGTGPGQLRYPRDVVILPNGTLAVVDYGNDRVVYFDGKGRFLGFWGRAGRGNGELDHPINAALTRRDLLIADSRNHRLVGTRHSFIGFLGGRAVTAARARLGWEVVP